MCCVNEKQSYSRQTVTYGKGCVRKDLFSIQNSISTLQALMHMLGGRHQVREDGTRHRNTKQVLPRGVVQWGANRNGYCLCCSDCVFLIGYLLACGSVEPNPGPEGENEDSMKFASGAADSSVPAQSNQAFLDRLHADMAHTLHQALLGTETVDQQQGRKIEGRPRSVQDKIDRRLYELEIRQTRLASVHGYSTLGTSGTSVRKSGPQRYRPLSD